MHCSMNWLNVAALVASGRFLLTEVPQALHRHRVVPLLVVPLRLVSPPQRQRGRFFGIGPPHHRLLPRVGCHTVDLAPEAQIYARKAYILRTLTGQNLKIPDLRRALYPSTPALFEQRKESVEGFLESVVKHTSSLLAHVGAIPVY